MRQTQKLPRKLKKRLKKQIKQTHKDMYENCKSKNIRIYSVVINQISRKEIKYKYLRLRKR